MTVQFAEQHAIDHDELLHAARDLYLLAGIGEEDALAFAAAEFLSKLERHVQEEADGFARLAPRDARTLSDGQRRLVELARGLRDLTRSGCSGADTGCRWRIEELLARCFVQVRDEGSILRRDVDGPSPQGTPLMGRAREKRR